MCGYKRGRAFTVTMSTNTGRIGIRCERANTNDGVCCKKFYCKCSPVLEKMEVFDGNNNQIGTIREREKSKF